MDLQKLLAPRSVSVNKVPLSPFWLVAWAVALSLTWLVPNHYPPWAGFHADAWIAMVLAMVSAPVILRSNSPTHWHASAILLAVLTSIPLLQYAAGLIPFSGQAWITTAYLSGLLLTLLIGQRWEMARPDQLVGGLFLAIGFASALSVNLQLRTWLGLMDTGVMDLWSMGLNGARPYANFGQPNQLATFLLWGMLACGWAYVAQRVRAPVALFWVCFLMVGVALTQSRTAWIGLFFLMIATWAWRRLWRSRWLPISVTALFILFWMLSPLLKMLAEVLIPSAESGYFRGQIVGELRPLAWRIFLNAVLERPWFGYGWTEVGHAQLAVVDLMPPLFSMFGHSHNLFLDLILWLGLPLGILISSSMIWLFISYVRGVTNAKDAILVMFLGVVGIHAMLELPLHYAYFLLPTGLVLGVLNSRIGVGAKVITPRWSLIALWLAATLLLVGVIRDYLQVEVSFQKVRFEIARIGTQPVGEPPSVLLLTQWRERIRLLRMEPRPEMTKEELDWSLRVVNTYPGGGVFYKVAKALALNDRQRDARELLKKICKISNAQECVQIKHVWAQEALAHASIAALPWPD